MCSLRTYVRYTREHPRQETRIRKGLIFMATQTKGSKRTGTAPKTKGATKAPVSEKNQARVVAEAAVDLPVGAVLTVTERVTELVEPFTGRSGAEKQLKSYRAEIRRRIKRAERRGSTARRKATSEARRRQRTVEATLKRNRNELEQRVRKAVELLPV